MSPQEVVCSFCGVATHSHKDCPVMHQYIKEQADALAQKRLEEYHQLQAWAAYESLRQVPSRHDPQQRGGGPHESEPISGIRPLGQQAERQGSSAKVRIIGSMYPHIVKSIAPGGGGGSPPPPGKGGPLEDKPDERSDEEENEEDDTDEETVSVTTSSQASAGGAGPRKWDPVKENYREGTGGPPEDPDNPAGGGGAGDGCRGPRGH